MTDQPQRPMRVFSGVQPTSNVHLGNYLGAIRRFVPLQDEGECIFCVVDLHAVTVPQDPAQLAAQTREIAATYMAAGIDPSRSVIFVQSSVSAHAELAWLLNCVARMGWLERMTQFKEKSGENAERSSVGLFTYPVLMAADILAYQATHVPVGEDQKQHLELARDVASRFNKEFKAEGHFPLPNPLIGETAARVMNLQDGSKKMSKSDPAELSRINLMDSDDTIVRKLKKARTDAEPLPLSVEGLAGRPEVDNLVGIHAALSNQTRQQVLDHFAGAGFGTFKPQLADLAVSVLGPLRSEIERIMADPAELDRLFHAGADRARAIAAPVLMQTRRLMGFWG